MSFGVFDILLATLEHEMVMQLPILWQLEMQQFYELHTTACILIQVQLGCSFLLCILGETGLTKGLMTSRSL
jgi:hypothetical protein